MRYEIQHVELNLIRSRILTSVPRFLSAFRDPRAGPAPSSLLDGCYHVYLDVGSNVGVQVRKLYEPELYPQAAVKPVFDEAFGK